MTPRELIYAAYMGAKIPAQLSTLIRPLVVTTADELAQLTLEYANYDASLTHTYQIDHLALSNLALEFHRRANTLTNGVAANIERLASNAPRLRLSHQPNLFPSLGIMCQFIFLDSAARLLETKYAKSAAQMFVIVDYDAAEDVRFRVSHFPALSRHGGVFPMSGAVPSDVYQHPMHNIQKPSVDLVGHWLATIERIVYDDLRVLRGLNILERKPGAIEENINAIKGTILAAYHDAKTLTEFNSFVISRIVNCHWQLPTAFIPARELQPLMLPAYHFLLQEGVAQAEHSRQVAEFLRNQGISAKYDQRLDHGLLPIWIECSNCNSRIALYCKDEHLLVQASCPECGLFYEFDLGTRANVDLTPIANIMAPRILFDNLLDILALRTAGATGYIGAAEHLLATYCIAQRLGWPVPPHTLFAPRGLHYGTAECLAALALSNTLPPKAQPSQAAKELERAKEMLGKVILGKESILYYWGNLGSGNLFDLWSDHYLRNTPVTATNDGSSKAPFWHGGDITSTLKDYLNPYA